MIRKFTFLLFLVQLFSINIFAALEGSLYTDPAGAPTIINSVTSIQLRYYETRVFKFIPTESDLYTIRSRGSSDAYARLFDVPDFADVNILAEGDDEDGLDFIMSHNVTAGTTYYILIYDYDMDNICDLEITGNLLPVELSSFTASAAGNSVFLNWSTATEVNNYGFEVERSAAPKAFGEIPIGNNDINEWEKIGFVQGNGNSNSPKQYSFVDKTPPAGYLLKYRIKQVDTDGAFKIYNAEAEVDFSLTSVEENHTPKEFALEQNYPNPFNPTTKIQYAVGNGSIGNDSQSSEQLVTLKVYDILGNEAATLVNEYKAPGYYEVKFNAAGLAAGVYFYKLTAGNFTQVKKAVLMK